ncbi:MAG: hypothetical protein DHS20C13_19770 [Thermodesulfobacteriota bacterium]|nr:MAG: hypothetical protein DHS20C13_19770 [Thermodesulfobacteriota bacterium]
MKYHTIMILTLALLLPFSFGCDNDNNSNAQDMDDLGMPGPMTEECPCFTELEILEMGKNEVNNSCINTIWGLDFLPSIDKNIIFSASCMPDGTSCECQNGTTITNNISANEVGMCMENILGGMLLLSSEGLSIECGFTP